MLLVVIGLQTAAQKAIFSMQPRRSTIESAEHVFLFVNTVRPRVCSYQRSTLAYMELSALLKSPVPNYWLMKRTKL